MTKVTLSEALIKHQEILGADFKNLGKKVGSFFGGKKVLLSYDSIKGFDVVQLDIFQLIVRKLFGCCYQSTHFSKVFDKWNSAVKKDAWPVVVQQPKEPTPEVNAFRRIINAIFPKEEPVQEAVLPIWDNPSFDQRMESIWKKKHPKVQVNSGNDMIKHHELSKKFVKKTFTNETHQPYRQRVMTEDIAIRKMWKNTRKAIEEHHDKDSNYVTGKELLANIQLREKSEQQTLQFRHNAYEAQGPRDGMEDAHFFAQIPQGTMTGVFDGHGGGEVANFASDYFQKRFSELLKDSTNVHQCFEKVIEEIHQKVVENPRWDNMGSTAVICFIDRENNIYTANLGDSEANIYRLVNGKIKSIPLSCVRDWKSPNDARRAADLKEMPEIAHKWPNAPQAKFLRVGGVNVARALGDKHAAGTPEKPGLIHKPKITINKVMNGDRLILACDGLKDYVPEKEIIQQVCRPNNEDLAKRLVDHALKVKHAQDNVTVVAIEVC